MRSAFAFVCLAVVLGAVEVCWFFCSNFSPRNAAQALSPGTKRYQEIMAGCNGSPEFGKPNTNPILNGNPVLLKVLVVVLCCCLHLFLAARIIFLFNSLRSIQFFYFVALLLVCLFIPPSFCVFSGGSQRQDVPDVDRPLAQRHHPCCAPVWHPV